MTDIGCRTSCCLHPCTSNTEVSSPGAGRSSTSFADYPTSQTLSSPLPAMALIASHLHTSFTCLLVLNVSPKLSAPLSASGERGKNRKSKNFHCATKHRNPQLLQKGLVPCSSFPDTLKVRRDEIQSLISNSGTGSPLETGCCNAARSLLQPIKATVDRNLYIHRII